MAEKTKTTFADVMADLRAKRYKPVYLLMGEENYYIDQVSEYIANNVLSPEERDFNQDVVFASDKKTVDAASVADMARQFPMMAERRVVIVKEAQSIKQWEPLQKYLEKVENSPNMLVLCYKNGTMDRRSAIFKAINSRGVVLESAKIKDWQLPQFIQKYLKDKNVSIDPKSTEVIANFVGSDLSRLTGELDKLLIGMDENNRRVTPEMVEAKIGVSKDFNTFELKNALIEKNVYKANQIVKYFISNPKGQGLFLSVPLLFNYFKNLMMAYYSPRKDAEGLADFLELKSSWQTKDYLTGMRNFTGTKVMGIINKLRETDAKMKGLDNPNTDAGQLLQELVFYILH